MKKENLLPILFFFYPITVEYEMNKLSWEERIRSFLFSLLSCLLGRSVKDVDLLSLT